MKSFVLVDFVGWQLFGYLLLEFWMDFFGIFSDDEVMQGEVFFDG